MAIQQDVKLFNRWSFDDVEVASWWFLFSGELPPQEALLETSSFFFGFNTKSVKKVQPHYIFKFKAVSDISLADYIAVTPPKHATYLPHTAGRYSVKRFRKAQCPIIERLTNSLMMHGRNNGKKLMAVRIIKHTMEIIHLLTDANPIQVIVDAIVNRRVNQAIYLLTTGAHESAFRNIKTIAECLTDELINAAKGSSNRRYKLAMPVVDVMPTPS
ncbi:40S ribosomal protein [Musa troglodytarum]|uniref:Small ribosomal subunit protein uS7c n=1 Tax=Musa troglodytarum TaxID=320322 RepID=A0A9E7KPG7_9LILI|nr:40S ribosomal protein [Musa troglodytarum]